MQAFYALAAAYLAVGLTIAWRAPAPATPRGWRGQLGALGAVLGLGLLWPEHLRAAQDQLDR